MQEIQKQFEKLKKFVEKFRSDEVDIQNEIENLNRTIKAKQNEAQHWSKKISDIKKQRAE